MKTESRARRSRRWCVLVPFFMLAVCGALQVLAVTRLNTLPRGDSRLEMQVALPRFVQLVLSGGDRYLAANIEVFRSLVAATENMGQDNYAIQVKLQRDAAWFNPAHEDNYYLAAAILPWNKQVEAAQDVLARASKARPFDVWPGFYHAFGVFMFEREPRRAALLLQENARRARTENERLLFESIAARWYQKGATAEETLLFLKGMAAQSRHAEFRAYLETRAKRLEVLIAIQHAVARYRAERGRPPATIPDLVTEGFLESIPADPYGIGYGLQPDGEAVLLERPRT